jgi:hypothetical protein
LLPMNKRQALRVLKRPWEELTTREAWAEWLAVAREHNSDGFDWWSDLQGCHGCRYLDETAVWCDAVELPATRNPVLNMLGMACCGVGYESTNLQYALSLEEPF